MSEDHYKNKAETEFPNLFSSILKISNNLMYTTNNVDHFYKIIYNYLLKSNDKLDLFSIYHTTKDHKMKIKCMNLEPIYIGRNEGINTLTFQQDTSIEENHATLQLYIDHSIQFTLDAHEQISTLFSVARDNYKITPENNVVQIFLGDFIMLSDAGQSAISIELNFKHVQRLCNDMYKTRLCNQVFNVDEMEKQERDFVQNTDGIDFQDMNFKNNRVVTSQFLSYKDKQININITREEQEKTTHFITLLTSFEEKVILFETCNFTKKIDHENSLFDKTKCSLLPNVHDLLRRDSRTECYLMNTSYISSSLFYLFGSASAKEIKNFNKSPDLKQNQRRKKRSGRFEESEAILNIALVRKQKIDMLRRTILHSFLLPIVWSKFLEMNIFKDGMFDIASVLCTCDWEYCVDVYHPTQFLQYLFDESLQIGTYIEQKICVLEFKKRSNHVPTVQDLVNDLYHIETNDKLHFEIRRQELDPETNKFINSFGEVRISLKIEINDCNYDLVSMIRDKRLPDQTNNFSSVVMTQNKDGTRQWTCLNVSDEQFYSIITETEILSLNYSVGVTNLCYKKNMEKKNDSENYNTPFQDITHVVKRRAETSGRKEQQPPDNLFHSREHIPEQNSNSSLYRIRVRNPDCTCYISSVLFYLFSTPSNRDSWIFNRPVGHRPANDQTKNLRTVIWQGFVKPIRDSIKFPHIPSEITSQTMNTIRSQCGYLGWKNGVEMKNGVEVKTLKIQHAVDEFLYWLYQTLAEDSPIPYTAPPIILTIDPEHGSVQGLEDLITNNRGDKSFDHDFVKSIDIIDFHIVRTQWDHVHNLPIKNLTTILLPMVLYGSNKTCWKECWKLKSIILHKNEHFSVDSGHYVCVSEIVPSPDSGTETSWLYLDDCETPSIQKWKNPFEQGPSDTSCLVSYKKVKYL